MVGHMARGRHVEVARVDWHSLHRGSVDWKQPVVIESAPIGDAPRLWTGEYLRAKIGHRRVVAHVAGENALNFLARNFVYTEMTVADLLDRCESTPPSHAYLRHVAGRDTVADMARDFPEISADVLNPFIPSVFTASQYFSSVLRIASPGLQLWTHYDTMNNVLMQIRGEKQVVLFAPDEVPNLYLKGDKSLVTSMDDADPQQFPLFGNALQWRTTMRPGDVLYIPALWFHNVMAKEFSVAVNIFWRELPAQMYDAKDMYGNRDPLPAQRFSQSLDKALTTLSTLPESYRNFYLLRSIERLQAELTKLHNNK